jgi:hypothetical protein
MGKGKRPRKPKPPTPDESPRREEELESPPALEPVSLAERRSSLPQRSSSAPNRPVLYDLLQTLRTAVGAMLDIADAAAEAITRRLTL